MLHWWTKKGDSMKVSFYRTNYDHIDWIPHIYLNKKYSEITWLIWTLSYSNY